MRLVGVDSYKAIMNGGEGIYKPVHSHFYWCGFHWDVVRFNPFSLADQTNSCANSVYPDETAQDLHCFLMFFFFFFFFFLF